MDTGVYCITDTKSGRRYVGSAVSLKKRWREHRRGLATGRHHSKFMQRTFNARPDGFSFQVLLYCNRENLLMYEQRFLDAWKPEFNTAPTAGSQLGLKMSDAAKAKMADAARRTRNFTGKTHSQETKDRIRQKKTGVKQCPLVVARRKATRDLRPIPPAPRKLSFSDVKQIRDLVAWGMVQKVIGDHYGVSNSVVCEIKSGKAYGWLK